VTALPMADGLSLSLLMAAAGVGIIHTLLGPDHYLPFVALARAQGWSRQRTFFTVSLCGGAHVLGSVILGSVGLALGAAIGQLEALQNARADWAAWCMVAFGVAYGAWGLRKALRHSTDLAPHSHGGNFHIHTHGTPAHSHGAKRETPNDPRTVTFWMLMLFFVLGPCEPLLPLFVLPAARGRWDLAAAAIGVYAITTITTMLAATALGLAGLRKLDLAPLERWLQPCAGATVAVAGLSVIFLGL
jgi:nickel/cobalt exporter